jgi:7-cyano-7-deazaguanine synthase in queuosine biosynthesis
MTMNLPDPPAYVVVLASGGLDSTTLAYRLRDMEGKDPAAFL